MFIHVCRLLKWEMLNGMAQLVAWFVQPLTRFGVWSLKLKRLPEWIPMVETCTAFVAESHKIQSLTCF